jgi:hypothetical protein
MRDAPRVVAFVPGSPDRPLQLGDTAGNVAVESRGRRDYPFGADDVKADGE